MELESRRQIAKSEILMGGEEVGSNKTYLGEAEVNSTDPRIRLLSLASPFCCLLTVILDKGLNLPFPQFPYLENVIIIAYISSSCFEG